MKTYRARQVRTCVKCNTLIAVGQLIRWIKTPMGKIWQQHVDCPDVLIDVETGETRPNYCEVN